ncbi:nineteen complex-related protein 2-domain-containing protein [Chaetomidium leptoderma]|uniref:Nineteen complex-related protein 2-domain-containing protein n=1 Tax=Chaetomidium leptoderma TaxID=669021 RepID=A0AAN6ZWB3_9PEZI|nr:nineteen complex-related protein 2-domain-containing protein [Chaetomidium leptoderma]
MSSFGAKRKARIIQTFDDEGDDRKTPSHSGEEQSDRKYQTAASQAPLNGPPLLIFGPTKSEQADALPAEPAPSGRIKFGRNKPAKSSALRKSININNDDGSQGGPASAAASTARDNDDEDGPSAPVVVRPALGRSGSTKVKKRPASSRLSFGLGEAAADEGEDAASGATVTKPFTPNKPLGQRLLETNALRKTASLQNLASSLPMRFGGQDEGPKYNKEYLEELQSSTPNTPQNLASLQIHDYADEMELDQSELEGALVVQSTDVAAPQPGTSAAAAAHILTDAEIRMRKERRARLANEAEFISLEDGSDHDDDDEAREGGRTTTVNFATKKNDSRLIAEDEDLGEGYDEFVSDGGLALGKKAEREAVQRHRQEMADMIRAAEDGSDAESDDSEAERRAAYEAAQRRAGMDGLHRPDEDHDLDGAVGPDAIPRMKPLPKLNEVLQRMRDIVQGLEDQVTVKRSGIEGLEKEKEEILAREKEVQEILNQAGAKYQAVVASAGGNVGDAAKMVTQSPLRPLPPGISGDLPVERGLESFGATPTRRDDIEMA